MDVHEYLKTVSSQIVTSSVREAIEEELAAHVSDQKEAFLAEGMEAQEAEEAAVLEMGDPIEVGLALNEIHKPKPLGLHIASFMILSAILLGANIIYLYFGKESTPDSKTGTVMVLLILMGVYAAIFLGIIGGSGYFSGLVHNEPLPFYFPAGFASLCLAYGIVEHLVTGKISALGDQRFYSSSLLLVFALLYLLFYYRRSRYAWLICFFAIAIFGIFEAFVNENLFLPAETTGIYAGIYTYAYSRKWFRVKKKSAVYLLWAIPAFCTGMGIFQMLSTGGMTWLEASVKNGWDYSLLPQICSKVGIFPAYLLLLLGLAADVYLLHQHRHSTNEWGKIFFLSAVLILTAMLINGVLVLHGFLPSEYTFTPFLWKLVESHETGRIIDFPQTILFYLLAGYTTRFVSRDSLLSLELRKKLNKDSVF